MTFEIVEQGIDVKQIEDQIIENMARWTPVHLWSETAPTFEGGGIIPLVLGASQSEIYHTMYYDQFSTVSKWIEERAEQYTIRQCVLYGLLAGMETPIGFDTIPHTEGQAHYCLVVSSDSTFVIGAEQHPLIPGTLFRYDPNIEHKWVSGEDHCAYVVFVVPPVESGEAIFIEENEQGSVISEVESFFDMEEVTGSNPVPTTK
jgi:hypothetical protein